MKSRRNRAIEKANNKLKYVESTGRIKPKEESIIADNQAEMIIPVDFVKPNDIKRYTTASNPKNSTMSIFEEIVKCMKSIETNYNSLLIGFNNLIDKAKNYEKR